ncbi:hypothetical protein B566_EDAN001731 [Ephemera danica]|nr:hypothetical protein B566_EDAN001731 [Ephemera danica]
MNPDIIRTSYFKYRDLLHADSNTNPATISLTEQPRLASYQKGWINEEDNAYVNCLLDLKGIPSYRNLLCLGLDYGQEGLICVLSCEGSVVLGAILCPTPCGRVLMLDLRRNDEVAWLAKDGAEPSDMMICDVFEYDKIEHLRVLVKTKIEMHLAFELFGLKHCFDNRTSVKSLLFCPKLFSLIVGFDAGFFEIWNLNTMELVQRSDTVDGPITRLVLQFPEDDPRHVCYLWAVEEAPDTFPQANMYCITCEERNVTPKYGVLYKGVGSVTLAHTFIMNYEHIDTYTAGKCLSAYNVHSPTVMTTEKSLEQTDESNKSDQIESLSPNDNLCSFTWIMWDEKGENHSQGFALFDLSVWYKLHMPTDTSHYYLMGGINYSIAVTHLQQLADYPDDVLLDARIAEFVLSIALEHGFDGFLKRCATSWADGEHAAADAILCVATHRLLPEPEPTANAQSLYPIEKFIAECQERRQAQSDQGSILIDVLVESCGSELHNLWRSEGGTGFYPPPTIRAFVHTFLLASVPTDIKHEIGVYFYMDVASLIEKHQPKTINVEQLRVYPSARPSIVKLAQAMWHLDHKEFKNACKILETPSIQATDFQPWKNHIMSTLALSDQLGMAVHLLSKQNSEESTVDIECEIWVKHGRISEAFCNLKMILELEQKNNPVTSADDREAVFKDRLSAFFKDVFHEGYVKNLMEQPLEYGEQELLKDVLDKENPNLCYVYLLVKNRMSDAQKFLTERNISKTLRVLCHQLSDNLTEVITRVMQLPVQNESVSLTCKDDCHVPFSLSLGREKRHLTPALQRITKETLSTPSNINQSDGPTSPKYPFCEAYAKSTHKDIKEAVSALIHTDCTKQIRFKSDTEDETWESITTNPDNNSSAIPPSTSSESSSSTADDKPVPSRRFSQHRWQQGKLKYHHEILPKKSSGSSVLSPSIGSEAEVHTMESQYGQIHHFQSSPCYSPRSPPRPSSPCYPPVTPAHNFQSSAFYSRMSPPHNLPSSPNYSPRSPPLRVKSRNLPNKAASFSPREGSSLGSTSDNPSTSKISPGKDSPTKNAQPADVPSDNERGVKERSVNDALNVKGACSDSSKNEDPKPSSGLEQKDLAVDKIGDSPIKSSVKLHQKGDAEADSTSHSCKSVSSSLENKDGVEESDSASHSVKTDTKTSPGSLENKDGDEESHSASHSVKTETKRAPSSQKIKDVDSAACEPGDQDDSQDTIIAPFCPRTDTPQSLEKVNDSSSDDCIVLGSSTDDDSPVGENEAPQENEDRENKVSGNEETDDEESSNSSDEASTDSNIEEDTSAEESKDEAESVNVNSSDDEPSSSSTPDADSCDEESHEETESVKPNDDFRETSDVPEASVNDETNKETESANPTTSDSGDADSENEEIPEDSSVANNEEPKSTSTIAASKTEQIPAGSECDKSKTDTQDSATLQVFFEHESPTSDLDITLHCSESLNSNENAPAVLAETPQLDTTIEAEPSGSGPEKCSASNKKSIPGNSSSVEEHNQSSNESYDALGERRMTRSQLKLRSQHCPLPIHTESIDCDTTTSLAPEKSTASTDDEPPRKVRRSSRISSTKRDSSADSTSRASLPKRARRRDSVTGDDSMSVTSNVSRRTSISESSSHYATRSVTAQTGREEFAELIHTPRSRRQSASSTSTVHSTKSIGKDD